MLWSNLGLYGTNTDVEHDYSIGQYQKRGTNKLKLLKLKAALERGDKASLKYDKLVIMSRGGQPQSSA